jgi:hypothetical protein
LFSGPNYLIEQSREFFIHEFSSKARVVFPTINTGENDTGFAQHLKVMGHSRFAHGAAFEVTARFLATVSQLQNDAKTHRIANGIEYSRQTKIL